MKEFEEIDLEEVLTTLPNNICINCIKTCDSACPYYEENNDEQCDTRQ